MEVGVPFQEEIVRTKVNKRTKLNREIVRSLLIPKRQTTKLTNYQGDSIYSDVEGEGHGDGEGEDKNDDEDSEPIQESDEDDDEEDEDDEYSDIDDSEEISKE